MRCNCCGERTSATGDFRRISMGLCVGCYRQTAEGKGTFFVRERRRRYGDGRR